MASGPHAHDHPARASPDQLEQADRQDQSHRERPPLHLACFQEATRGVSNEAPHPPQDRGLADPVGSQDPDRPQRPTLRSGVTPR